MVSRALVVVAAGAASLAFADSAKSATLPPDFSESIITGSLSQATCMEFAPDGRLFIAQQPGSIQVYEGSGPGLWTQVAPGGDFLTGNPLDIIFDNERGLVGIVFDPDYLKNRYLYLYYTTPTPANHNRVSRFTANAAGSQVVPGSETVLVNLDNVNTNYHNSGAMHFGPDGKLYVAVGDDRSQTNSQLISNRLGKLLRLNTDPLNPIPADNPTAIDGIAGTTSGANRAIWAAGLRNPFTFAIHPFTGRIHINDVGASSYEEVNLGHAGANFGWRTTQGPFDTKAFPDFTHPLIAYPRPNSGDPNYPVGLSYQGRAITGGVFYAPTTAMFPSNYVNRYFFSELVDDWIRYYDADTNSVHNFASSTVNGTLDLDVGPDGALYYLARHAVVLEDGRVFRVAYDLPPCPADMTDAVGSNLPDGTVDVFDLFVVLTNWNSAGTGASLAAPYNAVDVFDLFVVLGSWGACGK